MASDVSAYLGNKIIRWLLGNAMPTAPAGLYLAIFNGNPKTSGVEVGASIKSAGKRQVVTFNAVASGAAHLATSNIAADWGNSENATTFSHVAIFDDATAGNMMYSKAVSGGPISVLVNSLVKFNSGQITMNFGSDS